MSDIEYRIEDYYGDFRVKAKIEYTTGSLWWNKTHVEWMCCDGNGFPTETRFLSSVKIFKSFNEAKDQIDKFIVQHKKYNGQPIIYNMNKP